MLYESELTNLLSQWQERLGTTDNNSSYKDALSDCIYDLRTVIDSSFAEEALANEAFEQSLQENEAQWIDYFEDRFIHEGIVAV